MKLYTTLAFLFISYLSVLSQYSIEWEKQYGNSSGRRPLDLKLTSDGGCVLSGTRGSGNTYNGYVARISSEGDLLWESLPGESGSDSARAITEVSDGYIFVGHGINLSDTIVSNLDYWVVKLNLDGEIMWEQFLGGQSVDTAGEIIETLDGGYAIIGGSYSQDDSWDNNGERDLVLVKLTSDGQLEWSANFGFENYDNGNAILQLDNGNFMVGGSTEICETSICNKHFWLLELSSDGQLIWENTYASTQGRTILNTIVPVPNEGYLLGGELDADGWVGFVDLDGNFLWKNVIGGLGEDRIYDLALSEDNTLLGVGYSYSTELGLISDDQNILLFEIDLDGELLWFDLLGQSYSEDEAIGIEATLDGGYLIAGQSDDNSSGDSQALLMKIFLNQTSTSIPNTIASPRLYPNPTTNLMTINVNPQDLGSPYTIYNSRGQVCDKGIIESMTQNINVSPLEPGVFTFKINDMQLIQFIKL